VNQDAVLKVLEILTTIVPESIPQIVTLRATPTNDLFHDAIDAVRDGDQLWYLIASGWIKTLNKHTTDYEALPDTVKEQIQFKTALSAIVEFKTKVEITMNALTAPITIAVDGTSSLDGKTMVSRGKFGKFVAALPDIPIVVDDERPDTTKPIEGLSESQYVDVVSSTWDEIKESGDSRDLEDKPYSDVNLLRFSNNPDLERLLVLLRLQERQKNKPYRVNRVVTNVKQLVSVKTKRGLFNLTDYRLKDEIHSSTSKQEHKKMTKVSPKVGLRGIMRAFTKPEMDAALHLWDVSLYYGKKEKIAEWVGWPNNFVADNYSPHAMELLALTAFFNQPVTVPAVFTEGIIGDRRARIETFRRLVVHAKLYTQHEKFFGEEEFEQEVTNILLPADSMSTYPELTKNVILAARRYYERILTNAKAKSPMGNVLATIVLGGYDETISQQVIDKCPPKLLASKRGACVETRLLTELLAPKTTNIAKKFFLHNEQLDNTIPKRLLSEPFLRSMRFSDDEISMIRLIARDINTLRNKANIIWELTPNETTAPTYKGEMNSILMLVETITDKLKTTTTGKTNTSALLFFSAAAAFMDIRLKKKYLLGWTRTVLFTNLKSNATFDEYEQMIEVGVGEVSAFDREKYIETVLTENQKKFPKFDLGGATQEKINARRAALNASDSDSEESDTDSDLE
jgi:hypothetical protein